MFSEENLLNLYFARRVWIHTAGKVAMLRPGSVWPVGVQVLTLIASIIDDAVGSII